MTLQVKYTKAAKAPNAEIAAASGHQYGERNRIG
jgi:hypothetical protein